MFYDEKWLLKQNCYFGSNSLLISCFDNYSEHPSDAGLAFWETFRQLLDSLSITLLVKWFLIMAVMAMFNSCFALFWEKNINFFLTFWRLIWYYRILGNGFLLRLTDRIIFCLRKRTVMKKLVTRNPLETCQIFIILDFISVIHKCFKSTFWTKRFERFTPFLLN